MTHDPRTHQQESRTPQTVHNRPGLPVIRARVGTHARFKETMLSQLSSADLPALQGLTTREDGDLTIALLDGWAAALDVVAFYSERIANEAYLRTATERRSLVELANQIGYLPRPGVAASAHLAFTLDDAGTPGDVPVARGTRVQSIPGPGELPQVFETVEAMSGRPEWNSMRPVLVQPHPALTADTARVTLRGTATNLQRGDSLLLVVGAGAGARVVKRVLSVTPDVPGRTTRVDLAEDPPDPPPLVFTHLPLVAWTASPIQLSTASVTTSVLAGSWKQADFTAFAAVQKWPLPQLSRAIATLVRARSEAQPPAMGVFSLRQRAAVFGHNAPRYDGLAANFVTTQAGARVAINPLPFPVNWENQTLDEEPGATAPGGGNSIDLDQAHPGIVKGGWLVLETPTSRDVYRVVDNTQISRADYTVSAKVSRIRLDSGANLHKYGLRTTTVLAQSEELGLAELPVLDTIRGNRIVLESAHLGLTVGRPVVVSGERADLAGVTDSEVMTMADIGLNGGRTELTFTADLAHEYVRDSVAVNANVALATHGETVVRALGTGDGATAFQAFVLPDGPLTHVAADTPEGAASTLEVRVDHVLWQEVPWFHGRGPAERVYVTRTDDEGRTTVQFGDGGTGARLPSGAQGTENVVTTYRKGLGAEGLVAAGQLSLPLTRPLGVRSVTNPGPAGDSAAPEGAADIRRNASLPMRTLDRIVSLQDYEDFCRAFAGIGKALATWTWSGRRREVFVTVAGENGAEVAPGGVTHTNLLAAIRDAGDADVPVRVGGHRRAYFVLKGLLVTDPAHQPSVVGAAVAAALRTRFSFASREFGQSVAKSEVIAAIQGVAGVVAVDLDELHRVDATEDDLQRGRLFDVLTSDAPRAAGGSAVLAAELLLLDPRPIDLTLTSG